MSYVKSKSWHSVLHHTRGGSILTRCGRLIEGPDPVVSESLQLTDKSCEACLRLLTHDGERVETPEATA